MKRLLGAGAGFCLVMAALGARAAVLEVPASASIQDAVDAASPGDTIFVGPGEHCGATLDKSVRLVGFGKPTIVGCAEGPALANGLRVGFLLPGANGASAASGTHIAGFVFDGVGVSNENVEPLAFGVLARFANDVTVAFNRFRGTTQAVTNTAGDRWSIFSNEVSGVAPLRCPGFCTGGDGIVIQTARAPLAVPGGAADPLNRPEDNRVLLNAIRGTIPDGFDSFAVAGVLVLAADGTRVTHNWLSIPDNPDAAAPGEGVEIGNACCGNPVALVPGSRNTEVAFNDGRASELAVVVEGTGGANTDGLVLRRNRGLVKVEDAAPVALARAALTTADPRAPSPTQ